MQSSLYSIYISSLLFIYLLPLTEQFGDTAEAIRKKNEFKNYQYHAQLQEAHLLSEAKKTEQMEDTDEDYEGWFDDYAKGGKLTPAQFE